MNNETNFFIKLAENNPVEKNQILDFLRKINNDYPVSLVEKIDFNKYVNKVLDFGFIIVAKLDTSIIGILTFYANNHQNKEGVISLIGVIREYRSQGVARQLYLKSFEIMREHGMTSIFTFTHEDNISSIKFHKKMGFSIDEARESNYEYNISLVRKL